MSLATRLRTRTKAHEPTATVFSILQYAGKPSMAAVIKSSEALPERRMMVYKAADGVLRWMTRSATAFRDKDQEIVSKQALTLATAKLKASGTYGPLRWWHVGTLGEPITLDIGDCDFSFLCGETLYEGGTFRDPAFATMIKADDEVSLGFLPLDKDQNGVYYDIDIIERSLAPAGAARNLFTGVYVHD